MKPLFTGIFFLLSLSLSAKKIYVYKRADNSVSLEGLTKGDTAVFRASQNPYSYAFGYAQSGTVINEEGQVYLYNGFDIPSNTDLKITGSGSKDQYGFKITSNGAAISITKQSARIEIERVWIASASIGILCKNEANDYSNSQADLDWVLSEMYFHHNLIENCINEGMYLGSTDQEGLRPGANGRLPSKLKNIRANSNIIRNTLRPAIQLSNATEGKNEANYNTISSIGGGDDQQGSGITFGLYTVGDVIGNTIDSTLTWNISGLGAAYMRIENNTLSNSSRSKLLTLNWAQNIAIATKTNKVKTTFIIKGNKLSNPGKDVPNIQIWDGYGSLNTDNIIADNGTATIKTDAGVKYSTNGSTVPPVIEPPVIVPVRVLFTTFTKDKIKYNVWREGEGLTVERDDKKPVPALPTYTLITNPDGTLTLKKN